MFGTERITLSAELRAQSVTSIPSICCKFKGIGCTLFNYSCK